MTTINDIVQAPTVFNQVHQSVFRDHLILEYVQWLLEHETSTTVIADMILEFQSLPALETELQRTVTVSRTITRPTFGVEPDDEESE